MDCTAQVYVLVADERLRGGVFYVVQHELQLPTDRCPKAVVLPFWTGLALTFLMVSKPRKLINSKPLHVLIEPIEKRGRFLKWPVI